MILKIKFWILIVIAGILPCGCGGHPPSGQSSAAKTPAAATAQTPAAAGQGNAPAYAYSQGSIKKGDLAICVVCAVNEGSSEKEAAHEVLDFEGKTYAFCNEEEKAQFISSPAKFASK